MSIEVRSFAGSQNIDATDEGIIFGLAIPYNRVTNIGDPEKNGFREKIAPGACKKSLAEADIVALWNHRSDQPLGRTSAGNLSLKNSTEGVRPELRPVDTTYGRDLRELVKTGVVKGWSFGFEVIRDEWTDEEGHDADQWTGTNRTIREMKLIEVSPVTFPAYDQTEISSRSAILDAREERAKGFSDGSGSDDEERGGDAPGDGSKPYGNVTYADPGYRGGKKRYPIDSKKHVKAAWAYINKAKNAAMYTASQLASIKSKIRAAAKKFGVTISEENALELAHEWRCYLKDYNPDAPDATEERDGEAPEDRKLKNSTAKRIAQINVILNEALDALKECDLDKLPDGAQRAAALVSSAAEHSGHIMSKENLSPSDGVEGHDNRDEETSADEEQRDQPEPAGEATPAETLSDDALRLAYMKAVSREVELGL